MQGSEIGVAHEIRVKCKLFCLGAIIATFSIGVMAEEWRGIVPLRSTRADVTRILGVANEQGYYETSKGKVWISYGADDKTSITCWGRAPKNVVTEVSVSIDYPLNMKDLKTDIRNFKRTVDSHHPNIVTYTDWDKGIAYSTNAGDNEVYNIYYYPSRKDCDEMLGQSDE